MQLEEGRWAQVIEYLEGGNVPRRNFSRNTLHQFVVWERVLYYTITKRDGSELFCLIVLAALKQQALEETHPQVEHLGIEKTLAKIQGLYFWQIMKVDVIIYVRNCRTCQQYKGTTGLQQQWQELPPVENPLERVSLDLTDMIAGAQEYRYV